MRRIVALMAMAALCLCLVGCGEKKTQEIKIEGPDGKGIKVQVK